MEVTLRERASLTSASKVDRKSGRVSEVKLLGRYSKNGYPYSDQAMESAASKYPGAAIYKNHGEEPGDERGALEEIAVVCNEGVRFVRDPGGDRSKDAVFGPIQCFMEKEDGRHLLDICEKAPHLAGMSHDVKANVVESNGEREVADVYDVSSVDVVKRPATTNSMFESEVRTVKLSKFVESVKKSDPFHAILAEAAKTRGDFDVAEKATPQAAVTALLAEAAKPAEKKIEPVVEVDASKLIESIKPTLDGLANEVKELREWRQSIQVRETAIAVLQEHDIEPRPQLLKELGALPTREAMVERVQLWPDYVREPAARPIIESIRESEDGGDKSNAYGLKECQSRWGLKPEESAA